MLSQGNALKTVSEISTKSCTDTRGMICILPAKINCTNSCMSNDTLICLQCKVEDIQTIKQGQTLAKQLTDTCSDSRMTCYGETRLHKHILNWNKDKLLDTCSKPLTIQQGHFPVYSDISDTITFSENTKCTGNPECPRKQYESSELTMDYKNFINGTFPCESPETRNGGILNDVSKNTLVFYTVLCFSYYNMFVF